MSISSPLKLYHFQAFLIWLHTPFKPDPVLSVYVYKLNIPAPSSQRSTMGSILAPLVCRRAERKNSR